MISPSAVSQPDAGTSSVSAFSGRHGIPIAGCIICSDCRRPYVG